MSKSTFEVWDLMNKADVDKDNGGRLTEANAFVRFGVDFVSANYDKKGVRITMGLAGSPKDLLDLESGKKRSVLVLYDTAEYKRLIDEK